MPATVESPERLKTPPDKTYLADEMLRIETANMIIPVTDVISRAAINKSNANVSLVLQNALRNQLKFSKNLFGRVSLGTFNSLRGIVSRTGTPKVK